MRILSEPCPSGFAVFAASPPEMTPTARSLRRMRARMPSSATASANVASAVSSSRATAASSDHGGSGCAIARHVAFAIGTSRADAPSSRSR